MRGMRFYEGAYSITFSALSQRTADKAYIIRAYIQAGANTGQVDFTEDDIKELKKWCSVQLNNIKAAKSKK